MPAPPHGGATLVAADLSHDRAGRAVLRHVSVTVGPQARLGVVGPNGVGKSTLLRLLAGVERPDDGEVRLTPPSATVGYLAQEHEVRPGERIRQALWRRTGVAAAEAELAAAARALRAGRASAADRYAVALERYSALSAGAFDSRLEAVLEEVGIPAESADREVATLSGGEEARLALAAVMLSRFDITLLDEPTNDLDFAGLDLLEAFVARRPGGLVLVSHDRSFLAQTVTTVLEIDEHDHTARHFGGGWARYRAERETARRHAGDAYATYVARRALLDERARRERDWATSGVQRQRRAGRDNDKVQRDFRINRTEQLASRARRTERARAALDPVDKPWEGWDLRFSIGRAPRAGAVVARLAGAVVERGAFSMGPLDLEIGWADRVGLTGPNGSGKSTLVAALLGRLALVAGTRWLGPSVIVGELGQDRRAIGRPADPGEARPVGGAGTLLELVVRRCGLPHSEARSLLAKFGLSAGHVIRPLSSLSPGERTRGELAVFQALGVNFLVLDEPTNHLDLPAIEQLESALSGFDGTLLVVSHDRQLLEHLELTRRVELGGPPSAH